MSSNKPYSLEKPPQAPEKKVARKGLAERRARLDKIPKLVFPEESKPYRPEWRLLAESGYVRQKFLRYNPDDVAEIDDMDTLEHLRDLYTPASQPHNFYEHAYIELVIDAINDRLYAM